MAKKSNGRDMNSHFALHNSFSLLLPLFIRGNILQFLTFILYFHFILKEPQVLALQHMLSHVQKAFANSPSY